MKLDIMFANVLQGFVYHHARGGNNQTVFSKFSIPSYTRYFKTHNPDILCVAELLMDDFEGHSEFANAICHSLNYPYHEILPCEKSWLFDGKVYGLGIFSKFPIQHYETFKIPNPELEIIRPNGEHWRTHDKYIQYTEIELPEKMLTVINLHYFPLHIFNTYFNSDSMVKYLDELSSTLLDLTGGKTSIICGDFNNQNYSLCEHLPKLFQDSLFYESVISNTTVVGLEEQSDHILASKNILLKSSGAEIFLSDHYALKAEILI